jgi:hypothetical protein
VTKQERADSLVRLCEAPIEEAVLGAYRAGVEDAFACAADPARAGGEDGDAMTPAPSEPLAAGRALDARVHEALFGPVRTVPTAHEPLLFVNGAEECPRYSTDAGDAWRLLVPAMQARGYSYGVFGTCEQSSFLNTVAACFRRSVHPPQYGEGTTGHFWGYSEPGDPNPALALCRACLAALAAVAGRGEGEG